MWIYEKKLEFPVNIKKPDLNVARILMAQYGGPASELTAGMTYLTQRYHMPDDRIKATLTDIGTLAAQKPFLFFDSGVNTLSRQRAPRLNGPALAHFSVAVARISSASPSLRRLELNQSRLRSGRRVFTIRARRERDAGPQA